WSNPANHDPAWKSGTAAAGRLVPPASRVLDLGAGLETLKSDIPADCIYLPADVVRLSDRTILTDLNRGGFPDGQFDVVAALGVLEFVHDAAAVLTTARDRAGLMIATYCAKNTDNLDT